MLDAEGVGYGDLARTDDVFVVLKTSGGLAVGYHQNIAGRDAAGQGGGVEDLDICIARIRVSRKVRVERVRPAE